MATKFLPSEKKKSLAILGKLEEEKKREGVIKIYNPREIPFGPLSNDAIYYMIIDGKRWATVTNYILSNMLITPMYRSYVQLAPVQGDTKKTNIEDKLKHVIANIEARQGYKIAGKAEIQRYREMVMLEVDFHKMGIFHRYNHYLALEEFQLIRTALEKAYTAKAERDPEMVRNLLATGDSPILYISNNNILGIGPNRNGSNLIGLTLMQLRRNYRLEKTQQQVYEERQDYEDRLFNAYTAYAILLHEISKNNDLSMYLGQSPEQVIKTFQDTSNDTMSDLGLNEGMREVIVQMVDRGQYPILVKELNAVKRGQPGYMVLELRRENLRKISNSLLRKKPDIIFRTYIEYLLSYKYPNMTDKEIEIEVDGALKKGGQEQEMLKDRVVALYNRGQLSVPHGEDTPSVSDVIKGKLRQIRIPTTDEIENAERMKSSHSEPEEMGSISHTSSEENIPNPLELFLRSDEKAERVELIRRLQSFTGKSYEQYKKLSVEKLRKKLSQYEGSEKAPKKKAGEWLIMYKRRRPPIRTIEIGKKRGDQPTKEEIREKVMAYNANTEPKNQVPIDSDDPLKFPGVFVRWKPSLVQDIILSEDEDEEKAEVPRYIKPYGVPVEIKPNPEDNEQNLVNMSPLDQQVHFVVDNLVYPSISIYLTTMLLTHTGIKIDYHAKDHTYSRGMPVRKARDMLHIKGQPPNVFVGVDAANQIYQRNKYKTHVDLMKTFARIAMNKKFENKGLVNLLLMTGNTIIYYADPNDNFLGSGTKANPGQNEVGKILMQIRDKNMRDIEKTKITAIGDHEADEATLKNFMSKDSFMVDWVKMRLSDMCEAVYRVKHWLWVAGAQKEDIDARFVKHVLDCIFQSCSPIINIADKIVMDPPKFFVDEVSSCKGMGFRLSEDYDEQLRVLEQERDDEESDFMGLKRDRKEEKKIIDPVDFSKEQHKELLAYQETNPSEENLRKFMDKQRKDFEVMTKHVETAGYRRPSLKVIKGVYQRSREKWLNFKEKLNKPKHDWDYINRKMAKLVKKQEEIKKKSGIDFTLLSNKLSTDSPGRKLLDKQLEQRKELWKKLTEPELTKEEISDQMLEYIANQESRKHQELGKPHTPEEIKEHTTRINDIQTRILEISRKKKEEYNHHLYTVMDVARVYWSQLASMIYFLMKSDNATGHQVRKIIALSEISTSKNSTCVGELDDEQDNCVASALINLLVGINKFKVEYAEKLPLSTKDIQLAGTIILERDVTDKKVEDISPEDIVEEEYVAPLEFEDDMAVESGESIDDYGDENADFSFGRAVVLDDREKVKIMLREISKDGVEDFDELAKYFLNMMKVIKNARMSRKVKNNRINFFATLM